MQLRYLLFAAISFYLSLSPSCYARNGKIPAPIISDNEVTIAPSTSLTITGSGFVGGFPAAHQVWLYNDEVKFRLNILRANADFLVAELPANLKLGDYRSKIKIKTRFLRSPWIENTPMIRLRPAAPPLPKLRHRVVSHTAEIRGLFEDRDLNIHLPDKLATGLNPISFSYNINGYESIRSDALSFYYLPQDTVKPELSVSSTKPLITYAETNDQRIETSSITKVNQEGPLNSHYFLTTPSIEQYLLHSVTLSPVFISVVHAGDPEFIIIHNRNDIDFDLSTCSISDSIKARYIFSTASKIAPGTDLKIEANLSLNNDGDTVSFTCKDTVIDTVSYKSIDAEGYIVRQ